MGLPATKEEVENFISANLQWLPLEAQEVMRGFNPIDQKRAMSWGSMAGKYNPVSVLHTRVKEAKEWEKEFAKKWSQSEEKVEVKTYTTAAAEGYMFAEATEVDPTESKFGRAVANSSEDAEPKGPG